MSLNGENLERLHCIVFPADDYQIPKGSLARFWNITLFGGALDICIVQLKQHRTPAIDGRAACDAESTNVHE